MSTITPKRFTVREAAERFKRDPSRIRQICIEHEIGESIEGRIRILSSADMAKIGQIIDDLGWNKKSSG